MSAPRLTPEVSKGFHFENEYMDEMVFATLLILLKDAWDEVISEVDLIQVLYDGVADPIGLRASDGSVICVKKGTASKVFARQTGGNVRKDIRVNAKDPRVTGTIEKYFKEKVLNHILPVHIRSLLQNVNFFCHYTHILQYNIFHIFYYVFLLFFENHL